MCLDSRTTAIVTSGRSRGVLVFSGLQMNYSKLRLASSWQADNVLSQACLPSDFRPWMIDQGSLTAALTEHSGGNFQVNVLDQRLAVPLWHEQRKLHRPLTRAALIRKVELLIHGEAVVYARSIIPLALALNGRKGLAKLGGTPLGHLLFKRGNIRISKRQFAQFEFDDVMIAARRTPYDYQGSRILVTELFLPALLNYL